MVRATHTAPTAVLDLMRALSTDYAGGVVLDAEGGHLAGTPALVGPVRSAAGSLRPGTWLAHRAPEGAWVLAARSATHLVGVVLGPLAGLAVAREDLALALADLGAPVALPASPDPVAPAPAALASAVQAVSSGERER